VVELNSSASSILGIALIASGVLTCFFGYRLFKTVLAVLGFVTGSALAWTLLTAQGHGQGVTIAGTLLGGILGAAALFYLFYAGVFFFGAVLGLLIVMVVLSAMGNDFTTPFVGFSAAIGGLVSLLFRKVLVVASTALTGAWNVLCGASYFIGGADLVRLLSEPNVLPSQGGSYFVVLAFWIVLGVSGMSMQFRTLSKP